MTDLLITFVIPVLVIIASAILQTLLHCPYKVAGILFIILIIVAFILGATANLIILAWIYTFLGFITAIVLSRFSRNGGSSSENETVTSDLNSSDNNTGNNNYESENISNNNGNNNSCCNRYSRW